MRDRVEFHNILCEILGSTNVYFQPPENVKMNYPAIVYSTDRFDRNNADNGAYLLSKRYSVTLIEKDPDNSTVEKLAELPMSKFSNQYCSDNLYHYVFTIYY